MLGVSEMPDRSLPLASRLGWLECPPQNAKNAHAFRVFNNLAPNHLGHSRTSADIAAF